MIDQGWYPCVFESTSPAGKVTMAGPTVSNAEGTAYQMNFRLAVPLRKGNLRLHVTGCQLGVLGADPGNSVTQLSVNGMTHQAMDVMFESKEPVNMKQLKTYPMAPRDCSNFEAVCVRIWASTSVPSKLHLVSVSLNCYYA
jgi:hypothetical protein